MQDSSSSSSSLLSGSTYESETDSEPKPKSATSKLELTISSLSEISPSVKNILDKIDAAQLDRARKEVSKQLFVILDNVNRACDHFKGHERMDPEMEEQFFLSNTCAERKRRALLLEKVVILLKASTAQGKDLMFVLESFKEWDEMLSEDKEQVGDTPTAQWVSDMETKLLTSLDYTERCIMQLINLCTPLVEHRRKKRRKSIVSKTSMWRAWREKVVRKPQEAQPLSPEQMLEDESITRSRTSELLTMLQELVGSTLFNKAEAVVVKYIVTMVVNLTKAFTLQAKQCHDLQAKYGNLAIQESRKHEAQSASLQKEVQVLNEKKASLEARVQSFEHKYKMLLAENEAMKKEVHNMKEKAALKMESSLRDMTFGARASYERKSQEDNDLSGKKDEKLSAEKLSWKSQAEKSPSDIREAKVSDKKQLQKPLVERPEGTSNKQASKLLDKKLTLKASVERDKKLGLKALAERSEDTSDKQKALTETSQDTIVKWNAVIPVEKQETSGDLTGGWHEHPLDSEQSKIADEWDVNFLGRTQKVVKQVTGDLHEILPDEHELKADSEEATERDPLAWEPKKGKQQKESLYTKESHTKIPSSRSKLDPSTALYGFNSAILTYLEQKMDSSIPSLPPGQRHAERMLPKDPEAQRLYVALERKLEECFSKMKMNYSRNLEEHKLPRSLVLTEGHDKEAEPPLKILPAIFVPEKEVPVPSDQLSDLDRPFLESKIPVISQWGLPETLWKAPTNSMHAPFLKQWQQEWQQQPQEQWQKGEQEQFQKIQEDQQYQVQWQSPRSQQQLLGVKDKVEVEQLQQEALQYEEQEPLEEGQKEWQDKQKQQKKQLEEQAEEPRLQEEQQRIPHQCQEKQQQETYEKRQRLWQQQEEQEEQQRLWQEQEHVVQARHWQQQMEEHEKQRQLWQQEQEQHDLQLRRWQQQELKQEEQERLWQQQWQEQLQQLHEQELQQKQKHEEQEQYLIPRPKPIPRCRESATLEQLTKQIPLKPRREIAKEEVLLYEYFQPSAQQMVPTQSKVSLQAQAGSTDQTSWLPTLARKTRVKSFVPSSVSEKRYWVDVEAQRENLVLLGQATRKSGLPPHLHMQAKEVIIETLHIDEERLSLLFHKYISFCRLQHVRQSLMFRLEAARTVNDGAEVRNLYAYVEKVDAYQKKVLQSWVGKQKAAEQARRHCLGKMISLFAQLRLNSELHLNSPSPLMIKAVDEMKEFQYSIHAMSKSPGYPSPLASVKKVREFMHPAGVRYMEGWKC
ncbi:protein FAM186A [Carettochelys insculpta]|uniref:protein FAM186A n=1 Tax=Carettochelys insculpta TaxID=44489 RepID=UPI003EBD2094